MSSLRRVMSVVISLSIAACFCRLSFAQGAAARPIPIELYGLSESSPEHLASILDGSIWSRALDASLQPGQLLGTPETLSPSQRYLDQCNKALQIRNEPKTAKPARERYAAIRTYRDCVENARSQLIALEPGQAAVSSAMFQPLLTTLDEDEGAAKAEKDFMGLSFGVGIGASFSSGDRISAAEIGADGSVRATSDESQEPRVILESHYYGWCKSEKCNAGERGFGPFFGIVAKDDKLISAFALGGMIGWKGDQEDKSDGFSIGFGAMLDSDVNSLADGFEKGQPLPPGETSISFETKSRWGAILFFTRTF